MPSLELPLIFNEIIEYADMAGYGGPGKQHFIISEEEKFNPQEVGQKFIRSFVESINDGRFADCPDEYSYPWMDRDTFRSTLNKLNASLSTPHYEEGKLVIAFNLFKLLNLMNSFRGSTIDKTVEHFNKLADACELLEAPNGVNEYLNLMFLSLFNNKLPIKQALFKNTLAIYKNSIVHSLAFDRHLSYGLHRYYDVCWDLAEEQVVTTHNRNFTIALVELRDAYFEQLMLDPESQPFLDSIFEDTVTMIRGMSSRSLCHHTERSNALQEFIIKYDNKFDSKGAAFFKALGAVLLAGLAYLSIIGAVYLYQQDNTPLAWAKETCNVKPNNSLSRYLTFQPSDIQQKLDTIIELTPAQEEYQGKERCYYK